MGQLKSYITFELNSQKYGIELCKIREILTYTSFTKIPDTKRWVVGVIDSRDQAMPIVDLRIRFCGATNPTYCDKTVIIATKLSEGGLLGFIVDEIKDIENINEKEILEAKNIESLIPSRYLEGYIKRSDGMVILLDNEKIIEKEELIGTDSF